MKVWYNLMGVVDGGHSSLVAPQKPISHHLHRYRPAFSIIDIPHNDDYDHHLHRFDIPHDGYDGDHGYDVDADRHRHLRDIVQDSP